MQFFQQISIVSQRFAVLVDDPRLTHGEPNVGVPIQSIDEGLQQRGVRVIVRFGEPYIFTFRLAEPQVPLLEGTAVILCIESGSHILKPGVRFNDFATIVRGSIVKDEEFEVLKRLGQDAIDAFWQVPCVIIVRRDDGDSRHVAGPRWCQAARQSLVDGIQAQSQGQVADRTYVSKDAAMPCVAITLSLARRLIPRQATPQEDGALTAEEG